MHPTGGSLRVFKQFSWLEVGSVKVALSRPAHQRVTPAVGWLNMMKAKPILLIFLLMFVCSCSSNKVLQDSSTVVPPVTKKPTSTLPPTVIKLDTSTPTSVETKTPVPSKTPTSTETAVDYNALPPLRELVINESDFEDKDFDFSFYLSVGFQVDASVPVDVTSEKIKDCENDCAKFHWGIRETNFIDVSLPK